MVISNKEVVLGAPDRVNIPRLTHDTSGAPSTMAYIRCQNYILLLILLCDIYIAFCYMHGLFCYLISHYALFILHFAT